MVSHHAWQDDKHILAWVNHLLAGQRYFLHEDMTDCVTIVRDGILAEDAHPSFSNDSRWLLTDTYHDSKRCQTLILFDTQNARRYDLGTFFVLSFSMDPSDAIYTPRGTTDMS